MNNERGAVFPIIIVFAAVFIAVTLLLIETYIQEKQFYKETEEKLIVDHLVRLAVKDTTAVMDGNGVGSESGIHFYPKGDVYYEITAMEEDLFHVMLFGTTEHNRKLQVFFVYDRIFAKIVRWDEN